MATVKVYVKGEEGVPYKGVMLAMAWLTVNIQGGVWSLKGLDRTSYRLRILLDKTVSSCILRLTPRMPWRELCGSPTFVLFFIGDLWDCERLVHPSATWDAHALGANMWTQVAQCTVRPT